MHTRTLWKAPLHLLPPTWSLPSLHLCNNWPQQECTIMTHPWATNKRSSSFLGVGLLSLGTAAGMMASDSFQLSRYAAQNSSKAKEHTAFASKVTPQYLSKNFSTQLPNPFPNTWRSQRAVGPPAIDAARWAVRRSDASSSRAAPRR